MEELVGQSLDRYQLVSLLGEGGMGAVFKARDVTLQRDVAVKVMHPHLARQSDFQGRFLQEARTAARMNHPGIVQVYDFGHARAYLYIVMEFIPGANLRQMLKDLAQTNQWIILPEALQLVQQVSSALDYAHRHGVLHRDIKPNNIMVKPEPSDGLPYRPVLTDLGLAKLLEGGLITQEGVSMGTPAYMSPEQALGNKTDLRSDVYSLGILLFELAVGRLPFPAKTISEAIRYHTKEPPPPPRSIRPDLPEPVEHVILKAIAKSPAQRFPDAKALAQALADVLPTVAATTTTPAAPEGAVSLLTQYQASLVEPRGPSILAEFPEAPPDLSQDRVVVMSPDRTTRSFRIKPEGLVVGRANDSDVVIDGPRVSRRHARIEFDGTNYRVTDLNSTNGTYLANVKILPGVAETWPPDRVLHIGDSWLRLERAQQPQAVVSAFLRSDGTMVDPSLIHSSGAGRVGVFMETTELSVTPGGSTTTSAIVLNQGAVVDHFQVSVAGIPAAWVPASPAIQLMPGQQQTVTITIQPPRASQSQAGRYAITVRVTSRDAPDQVAEVHGGLTVTSYSQFSSELYPQKLRAGQAARVTVENRGNAQETFTVSWKDRAAELVFEPAQTPLPVPPGQTAVAAFRATPRQRRWIGGTREHPFTTQVRSQRGEAQTLNGEVVSKARLPGWLLSLLTVGLSLLACACLVVCTSLLPVGPNNTPLILAWLVAPTPTPEPGTPVVDEWSVFPTQVAPGDTVTIRWQVRNAESVTLQPFGTVDAAGERQDKPQQTKTYTLIATNAGKTVQKSQEVVVTIPPPDAPKITSFTVTPSSFVQGAEATVRLAWTTEDADTVTIEPGIGPAGLSGNRDVPAPSADTIYTLVAKNAGGEVKKQVQVKVTPSAVTGVQVDADPSDFSGECPKEFDFSAQITLDGSGTVTYRWERSDGTTGSVESLTFAQAGAQTISSPWTLDSSGTYWARIRILTPNEMVSSQATVKLDCVPAVPLEGTQWVLKSYMNSSGNLVNALSNVKVTAKFQNGQVGGSAGCNSYSGSYQVNGGDLTVAEEIQITLMFCTGAGVMQQESQYLADLKAAAHYRIVGSQLQITNSASETLLTFTPE